MECPRNSTTCDIDAANDELERIDALEIHKGWAGDEITATFDDANAAVEFAMGLQRESRRPLEELGLVRERGARVGLNYGGFVKVEGEIWGSHALLALKLQDVAPRGTILASGQLVELLQPGLRSKCRRFDLGERAWRFRKTPVEAWEITWADAK